MRQRKGWPGPPLANPRLAGWGGVKGTGNAAVRGRHPPECSPPHASQMSNWSLEKRPRHGPDLSHALDRRPARRKQSGWLTFSVQRPLGATLGWPRGESLRSDVRPTQTMERKGQVSPPRVRAGESRAKQGPGDWILGTESWRRQSGHRQDSSRQHRPRSARGKRQLRQILPRVLQRPKAGWWLPGAQSWAVLCGPH